MPLGGRIALRMIVFFMYAFILIGCYLHDPGWGNMLPSVGALLACDLLARVLINPMAEWR